MSKQAKFHIPCGSGLFCGQDSFVAQCSADHLCRACVRSMNRVLDKLATKQKRTWVKTRLGPAQPSRSVEAIRGFVLSAGLLLQEQESWENLSKETLDLIAADLEQALSSIRGAQAWRGEE